MLCRWIVVVMPGQKRVPVRTLLGRKRCARWGRPDNKHRRSPSSARGRGYVQFVERPQHSIEEVGFAIAHPIVLGDLEFARMVDLAPRVGERAPSLLVKPRSPACPRPRGTERSRVWRSRGSRGRARAANWPRFWSAGRNESQRSRQPSRGQRQPRRLIRSVKKTGQPRRGRPE